MRINIPHFEGDVVPAETGIFWFGKVTERGNYTDVRVAFSDDELFVRLTIIDHSVWYNRRLGTSSLDAWDAVSLYLDTGGNAGDSLDADSFRLVSQFSWWEDRPGYQEAYQGSNGAWSKTNLPFETSATWRGNAPNDSEKGERGWTATYRIPFASLGLSGAPQLGSLWGLGVVVHDRDDELGNQTLTTSWPENFDTKRPASYGQMLFGMPAYDGPSSAPQGTSLIRQGLNGARVVDGMVGGAHDCGSGTDFWTTWGESSYPGATKINIQNQSDVGDFPCFSKFFLIFPLDQIPAGKAVHNATLTVYQFGNSGGGKWGEPEGSLIQVSTVAGGWDENTINWNNAPAPVENIGGAWVKPLPDFPGWPGVAHTWDVSRAVADALAKGQKFLYLTMYSADSTYHTGKYFTSSDAEDWNAKGRPALEVEWGNP